MDTKNIHISDFDYNLPDERIAKFPLKERDHSKLLIYNHGQVSEDIFYNITKHLPKGALMIFNNTRVIQARIHFRKSTGALIEVFLMEPADPTDYELMFQTTGHCAWLCMVGNLKKWKDGPLERDFEIHGQKLTLTVTMDRSRTTEKSGGTNYWVNFDWDNPSVSFAEILDAVGELPIPPYLNRKTEDSDKTTYQTVYSKIKGSVAAPTAGLHFTEKVLHDIDDYGIQRDELTLHVGAGTFKPVKSEEISGHNMHTEYIVVHRHTFERLLAHDCKAIAVGTTSVRTLESLYYMGVKLVTNPDATEEELHVNQWEPYDLPHNDEGLVIVDGKPVSVRQSIQNILDYLDRDNLEALHSSTQIIIAPGYTYKIVKILVTNFHQPQSTLLLLVSAFVHGDWRRIYDYALGHGFRFLSYGDCNLIMP
ncbi:S-adenosylmethionine:tRNA ribosyltransferase-isomerase [Prevotella lacticifex]|jgi:S-adenosylmethionine:tRNA ribosyltransferase-isomerase|uniref:S-adenosylmethionine:tRNA ribosyltransferase-isomerase n=1 Tax=Prevotella lacticifex TaxID=2854755 RepID=A0A9R1CXK1_9BACT|nr:S-adenosylmethionine:tRNA ribosyltransferase-isomerase [Prevotella lacticifex]MDY6266179.1 S-adenosylmethionine:tRNA ribosyltransferase-isomerase [Prevotella sp.]GJG35518.1 S-adenosylmethionine:tRNA ribosyltransferase-isomerase [Prevotella lacticifex]GJG39434.1 S-adenosylmethionine:tRNA ribosyltransferase-isomerase [Prevotella lacticifex]GJG41886.1 S-adenosylmethionine:tRNA ribosyltransferase-isomerase [Prevotella lacticifex]GJG45788.1 S-adenosylmethionine:tRNA ribosyltransferase-isomerase 